MQVTQTSTKAQHPPTASAGGCLMSAPVCCGRPMQASNGQYVCRKCGAWTDPGN